MKNILLAFKINIEYFYQNLVNLFTSGIVVSLIIVIYYGSKFFFDFPSSADSIFIISLSVFLLFAYLGMVMEAYDFYFNPKNFKNSFYNIDFLNKFKTQTPKNIFLKSILVFLTFFGTIALSLSMVFIIFGIVIFYLLIIIFIISILVLFIGKFF